MTITIYCWSTSAKIWRRQRTDLQVKRLQPPKTRDRDKSRVIVVSLAIFLVY
jgi:hypothetical protein